MSTARTLRGVFASILASSMAGGTVAATIGACGAATGDQNAACRPVTPGDASTSCGTWSVTLTGDFAACGFVDSGYGFSSPSDPKVCAQLCNQAQLTNCQLRGDNLQCGYGCRVDGRRYDGLRDELAPSVDGLGAYFARMAFFEAASVDAFVLLETELRAHGAPRRLLASARAAARDEVRHASLAKELADRHGGESVPVATPTPRAARSLVEIARENAVEGCVREAFGALVAGAQAVCAEPALSAFFSIIHRDETRHAALAFDVDRWLMQQLSEGERDRVDEARREALATLSRELDQEPPSVLVDRAGHPIAATARALLEAFVTQVGTSHRRPRPRPPTTEALGVLSRTA